MSSSPALAAGAASHRAQDQRAVRLRTRIAMTVFVALTAVLAAIPLATSNISFAFYLMLWITMASAMNICVGFTGYLPFGYVVFYGVGSYATGICYKILGWPILPSLLAAGCAQTITGTATRAAPGIDDESQSPVDVESVMLDQAQMQAITGAGEALTIVPSMDG